MKPKHLYAALAVAGAVIPCAEFVPWLAAHGLDLRLLIQDVVANQISIFFGLDVIVSAMVVFAFIAIERRRVTLALWWVPMLAVLCVGVSLGLPLVLYLREVAVEKQRLGVLTR